MRQALRVEVDLWICLDRRRRIQSAILDFNASVGTSSLPNLLLIVFERENYWHEVR